jgi:hypothetical protein
MQMMRWSNWDFMQADLQYFITQYGQTDYWIGPTSGRPKGTVDTRLNLPDVDKIRKDSVRDLSNDRALKWFREMPIGPVLNFPSGASRPGQPAGWRQDPNTPFLLSIYPAPNNQNTYQPVPSSPVCDVAVGGALADRIYWVKITIVDSAGNESSAINEGTRIYVPAGYLVTVRSPKFVFDTAGSGIKYNQYNVYAVQAASISGTEGDPQTETLQNVSPIATGTDWAEPGTGLITTGVNPPQNNSVEPLGGYICQFRYFRSRLPFTNPNDVPQVPEKYKDILIAGTNTYGWAILGDDQKAAMWKGIFDDGYRQMVVDKNLFPEGAEFIRPDSGSYVNQQILGYLPPFFLIF